MAFRKYSTKQGPRYEARCMVQGQMISKRGFRTQTEAKAWIADSKRKKTEKKPVESGCSNWFSKYLHYNEPYLTPGTVKQKEHVLAHFIKSLGQDMPLSQITRQHILDFQRQTLDRTENPTTANRHLRDIRAAFRWLYEQRIISSNPCDLIKDYPETPTKRHIPTQADVAAVLLAADREQLDLLLLFYFTGGRLSEILGLKKEDYDFFCGTLTLRSRKGGKLQTRTIKLPEQAREIVERRIKESSGDLILENPRSKGPYSKQQWTIKYMMQRLCKRASVEPFTLHALRHHVASILIGSFHAGSINLKEVQAFLGHARASTTDRYLHSLASGNEKISDALNEVLGSTMGTDYGHKAQKTKNPRS